MTRPPTFLHGHGDDAFDAAAWIAEHGAEPIEGCTFALIDIARSLRRIADHRMAEECLAHHGVTHLRGTPRRTVGAALSPMGDIPAITSERQARSHGSAHTRPGPGRSATPLRIFSTKRPQKVPLSEIRVRRPLP